MKSTTANRFPVNTRVVVLRSNHSGVKRESIGIITADNGTGYTVRVPLVPSPSYNEKEAEVMVEDRDLYQKLMTWGEIKKANEKTPDDAEVVLNFKNQTAGVAKVITAQEPFIILVGGGF